MGVGEILDRRTFLKSTALLLGGAIVSRDVPTWLLENENKYPSLTNVAQLDFFSPRAAIGNLSYGYLDTLKRVKHLAGDNYVSIPALIRQYGLSAYTENVFKNSVTMDHPEFGLVAAGMFAFMTHGVSVAQCHAAFSKSMGYQAYPTPFAVQNALRIEDLHAYDGLGNPAVIMDLSVDPLIDFLAVHDELDIVNLSLQVGKMSIIHKRHKVRAYYTDEEKEYDLSDSTIPYMAENMSSAAFSVRQTDTSRAPFFEIQGAYTSQYGDANIQELLRMVRRFPKKLFVAAIGNYGDDIRPFRVEFGHTWPSNLMMTGHWDSLLDYPRMFNTYNCLGADVFCNGMPYGHEAGSSMSTGVLSAAASILHHNGMAIEQIPSYLFSCCDEKRILTKPSIPRDSINIEDYIYAEQNKREEVVNVFNPPKFLQALV